MTVESTLVRLNQDPNPPDYLSDCLWVSRLKSSRNHARRLAELALPSLKHHAAYPKACAVMAGPGLWRGIIYAGRRTHRQTAKAHRAAGGSNAVMKEGARPPESAGAASVERRGKRGRRNSSDGCSSAAPASELPGEARGLCLGPFGAVNLDADEDPETVYIDPDLDPETIEEGHGQG